MSRHDTISYPRRFVEPVFDSEGNETSPGYWIEMYQEDVLYTPGEELSRDVEEAQSEIDRAAEQTVQARKTILDANLTDDSITFDELKELMRLRG